MKLFICLTAIPTFFAVPCPAQVPVPASLAYDGTNPTNQITLTWEAIPTKLYNILTTTALGQQPW